MDPGSRTAEVHVALGLDHLGLVHHLALDGVRFWFSAVMAGDQYAIDALAKGDEAWRVSANLPGSEVFERYLEEAAQGE
jgi:hypothetical protein